LGLVLEFVFRSMNVSVDGGETTTTLVQLLGESVSERLVSLLLSDCLSPAVPSDREQLPKFEAVLKRAEKFNVELAEIGFLKVPLYFCD
jgi:hypothetical protein